jgi:hypothetical protein
MKTKKGQLDKSMKLCWAHNTGETTGLFIIARNRGRAAHLFCLATGTQGFRNVKVERIPFDVIDQPEEAVLWPGSDIALMYGVPYDEGVRRCHHER